MLIYTFLYIAYAEKHFENVFLYDEEYYKNNIYVSRVYHDANFNKLKQEVDPHYLEFKDGNISDYQRGQLIGQGAFSQVYLGQNIQSKQLVVLKVLKQQREVAINREILILQQLNGTQHTPILLDAIRTQNKKNNATLVYKFIKCQNLLMYFGKLNLLQIKYYMYQLLQALDNIHSQGVMHRDLKMANIVIDEDLYLTLIDWGLGEFYHPKKRYNTRVGTRYYKAPEMLVNNTQYDYAVDMWAFGCTLGSLIFKRQPLFKGKDNYEQLNKIAKVLGTDDLTAYLQKYDILYYIEKQHSKKPLSVFVTQENFHLVTVEGLDLLTKILVYDQRERLTAKEAMNHKFFS